MNKATLVRSLRAIERSIIAARLKLPPCNGLVDRLLYRTQIQTLRTIARAKGIKPTCYKLPGLDGR